MADLRVFFITRKWPPSVGGMETYSVRLTEELEHRVSSLEVVALSADRGGKPPSAFQLLRFPLAVLRRWRARKWHPNVIHVADMASWPLALLAKLTRTPPSVVFSAHGTDVSYPRRGGFKGRLYSFYLKLGARLFDGATVLANSHATAEALRESGWRNAEVVPLATDMRREGVPLTHNKKLLFVGRLIPMKGLSWFVENVLPQLPDEIEVDVAGTVWDKREAFALGHPRVHYLGALSQQDLVEAYGRALCVILPNVPSSNGQFEGFGLVAPEAAASGGVLLAARSGGLADAVLDGETGFLLAPAEPQAWIEKIIEVREWDKERRRAFIKDAMKCAQRHYSWHRVADSTAAAYCRSKHKVDS